MKILMDKLARIKARYAHWNKLSGSLARVVRNSSVSECEACSASSGDGCHGDGQCGGDGE
jgi:hypothetical protein